MAWNPAWANAIASIESHGSGGYSAVGPQTAKGNRAYGKYQVMDFNIPTWTQKHLGQKLTPEQFLASPEAQDAVFRGEFGASVQKYGNPQDAASVWFTGRPASQGAGRSDILGTTGAEYVNKFNSALGQGMTTSTKGPQMMQEEKPRGLLGSLGIQKMEEGAEGETGQRFYNRDSFKDTAAVLAQGFGRMGIMGMEEIADSVAKQRTEVKAKNKTMEALMKMGTPQAQAAVEYINAGGDPVSALKMAFERPQAGVAVGDRLVNPVTGEVIYEDASAPKFDPKDVVTARKEFSSLPPVKQFSDQTSAYGRVVASVDDPSPSGDLALIFNFMKVLDPGSVVREGEFATAQNAGGIDQRTRGLYNRITSGERLTPEQRADFADRATRLYSEAQGQYQSLAEQYAGFAKQAGLPVDQVIPDFSYSKDLYRKPLEFSRPPPPTMPDGTRVSPEEWATAWSNMTEAQRQEFINGGAN